MINELTTAQIESLVELYIGYFTRAPEAAGLNFWKGQYIAALNAGKGDNQALTEIADRFYDAALQFSDQTGYAADDTPAEFIQKIYANVLLRTGTLAPPQADIQYWEQELSSGRVTLGGLVKRMISDAKAFDGDPQWGFVADTLANRKVVAAAWAESEEGQAISGPEAVLRGKAILSTIDDTPASLQQALGIIADLDSGATTVFTGDRLGEYANGTLKIDDNLFARQSTTNLPETILVANGADLVVDGVLVIGGVGGSVTVRGAGSSLLVSGAVDDSRSSRFPDKAGGEATLTVANGATATFDTNFQLGGFAVAQDGDQVLGILGGDSVGTLQVLGGGKLVLNGNVDFAAKYGLNEDEINDGTETGTANVSIQGAGSRIDVNNDYAAFGVSEHGKVNLSITQGGVLSLQQDAGFGRASDYTPSKGGDADVLVQGDGSQLLAGRNLQFGEFVGSDVKLVIDNGGLVRSEEFQFARVGAHGELIVSDGGLLEITQYVDLAQYSGSTADIKVIGGTIRNAHNLNVGSFDAGEIFDDGFEFRGIANGHTTVDFLVSGGGKVISQENVNFAFRYEPRDIPQGNETSTANLTVTGIGSVLEAETGYSGFGVSAGAIANVSVLAGGQIILGRGGSFGEANEDNPAKGGEANVVVDGMDSILRVQRDIDLDRGGFDFGRGENAHATLMISNGGTLESRGLYFGGDGGKATGTIDGGQLKVYGADEEGYGRFLEIGREASSQGASTMTVQNGGSISIDGQGERSPGMSIGHRAGAEGNLIVMGTASKVTIINDAPMNGPNSDFGNALVQIGQDGKGFVTLSQGATFTNTTNGVVDIGQNQGGNGNFLVIGNGTTLNYGAAIVLADGSNGGGTAELNIQAGAIVNQTGVVKGDGGDFGGVNLRGAGATLVLDSFSTFNSDLHMEDGRFIVSGGNEAVKINGDFEHDGGVLEMELGIAVHDMLDVTGLLELDGTLNIRLLGSLAPVNGDKFELFTANDIEVGGSFALDVDGLAAGMDAQVQITGGIAVIAFSNTPVSDFVFL